MKKLTLAVVTVAGLALAPTAFAMDDGWYMLAGVGRTTSNSDKSTLDSAVAAAGGVGFSSSLNEPTVYKLQAGYKINKNFAVEGGYLGSNNEAYTAQGGNLATPLNASAHVTGWNVTAVGILPLSEQFSLLGKLGIANIRGSATVSGGGITVSADGTKTSATYGIGAQYDFTKQFFGRFDVDSYNVGSSTASDRSTVWMVNVGFHF